MANGDAGQTVKGNLRCVKLSDICRWIKNSWNDISDDIIINYFKTCKILNPINENIDEEFEIIEISDDDNQNDKNNNGDDDDGEDDDNNDNNKSDNDSSNDNS